MADRKRNVNSSGPAGANENEYGAYANKKRRGAEAIRRKTNRSLWRLFFKTFIVSCFIFVAIMAAGWFTLNNWEDFIFGSVIKAPEIPDFSIGAAVSESEETIETGDAFHAPEHEDEDASIGGDRRAPEGFTHADRKELFYTFLIFGLDDGVNTDTIMVASYDGLSKTGHAISIPRDSKVNVKRGVKKINSAYPAGTLNGGGRQGGVEQLKRELMTIIGFVPDFYVCVDFNAFVRIVNAVGGVEVTVPFDLVYDDPYQNLHINIQKGFQRLYGEDALKFARYRQGNRQQDTINDYQRIENQQAVIKAVFDKLLKPSNIDKIPEFIDIFKSNVFTDIKLDEMAWFARELGKIMGTEALEMHTMPTCGNSGTDGWYEFLDEPAVLELLNRTINPFEKDIEAKDLDIIN